MTTKIIRDFAPTKDNNRNSEGSFITLKNGNIMFAYSRYGGEGDDDGAAADIYASISTDGGESFGEPYVLVTHTEMNADNIMSAGFMRMANGDIGLFFLVKTEMVNCLSYLIRSSDEGKTWGKPVLCSEDSGYFVVNNDRPIRTKSGRILVPAALHGTICLPGSKFLDDILPGAACFGAGRAAAQNRGNACQQLGNAERFDPRVARISTPFCLMKSNVMTRTKKRVAESRADSTLFCRDRRPYK